jgi:hypothetical protein
MAKIAGFASRLLRIPFDYWDISFLSISLNFFVIVVLIVVVLVAVVILRRPSAAFLFSSGPPYFRNEALFAGTELRRRYGHYFLHFSISPSPIIPLREAAFTFLANP